LDPLPSMRLMRIAISLIAVMFGLVTIIAGTHVLAGSDPGYNVFSPLLLYNTVMGSVYILAGITMWINLNRGKHAAAAIFILNFFVLAVVGYLYTEGSSVALDSIRAMTFRTIVWFLLFFALTWLCRRKTSTGERSA
jgi:hypothetical protein